MISASAEEPDMANHMDSIDDLFRDVIMQNWPGKERPGIKQLNVIVKLVNLCIAEAKEARLIQGEAQLDVSSIVGKILAFIESPLHLRCLKFVFNLEASTETEIGFDMGVTKQRVSQICIAICDELGVIPSRGMRSSKSRESYRKRAQEVHSRPKPQYPRSSLYLQAISHAA